MWSFESYRSGGVLHQIDCWRPLTASRRGRGAVMSEPKSTVKQAEPLRVCDLER